MKTNKKMYELFRASLSGEWNSSKDASDINNINTSDGNYYSEKYNEHVFNIDTNNGILYTYSFKQQDYTIFCRYRWFIFPLHFGAIKNVLKIKKTVKNKDKINFDGIFNDIKSSDNMTLNLRKNKLVKLGIKT